MAQTRPRPGKSFGPSQTPTIIAHSALYRCECEPRGGIYPHRNRAIEMCTALPQVSSAQQANARHAMRDCERPRLALLLGQRKELRDSFAHSVEVKRYEARDHSGIHDRKEYQRIFGRFSVRLGLFD